MSDYTQIKWEVIEQNGKMSACANRGETVSRTMVGTIGDKKFIKFETLEAYYNESGKYMDYKPVNVTVLPLNE